MKMANTMLLHARLSKKFFYYAAKYAQRVHDVIPVRDIFDSDGLPTAPHQMATGGKLIARHFRVFGCLAIFKRYEISDKGTRIKNKYPQQGMRGIFVGLPNDSAGWLFYVPSVKKSYSISLDATFDENFTSPLSMPDLPYQGAIKIRNTELGNTNSKPLLEKTGIPTGKETSFPDNSGLPQPKADSLVDYPKDQDGIAFTTIEEGKIHDKQKEMITAYFSSMEKFTDSSLPHSEFCTLHMNSHQQTKFWIIPMMKTSTCQILCQNQNH